MILALGARWVLIGMAMGYRDCFTSLLRREITTSRTRETFVKVGRISITTGVASRVALGEIFSVICLGGAL